MRLSAIAAALAFAALPGFALAQGSAPAASAPSAAPSAAAPSAAAKRSTGDITRDQYIERAKEQAAARFDRMDADHDGVLTADERRAYRGTHHRTRRGRGAAAAEPTAASPAPKQQ